MDSEDNWNWPARPTNQRDYDIMMSSVDNHLASHGLPPNQRALRASRLVSVALKLGGIPLLGVGVLRGVPYGPTDLGPRVFDWYSDNYGERNKIDWSPGSVVMTLHRSLWRIRMPMIMGTVEFIIARDLDIGEKGNFTGRHPPKCNVLHEVEGLTQSYANRLSDHDLIHIFQEFQNGYASIGYLNDLHGHDLFDQARGDYKQSVDTLMDGRTLSKARWDNAQCAEKIFKGLLARDGHPFPTNARQGHDIAHLGGLLKQHLGIELPESSLRTITCLPAARYGEINVDANEAWTSHKELLATLRRIGSSLNMDSGLSSNSGNSDERSANG
ncbi:MAG: hypothetical protein ABI114_10825 [Rhodanobacter sp.]